MSNYEHLFKDTTSKHHQRAVIINYWTSLPEAMTRVKKVACVPLSTLFHERICSQRRKVF